MAAVFYSPGAFRDLERLAEFLVAADPSAAAERGRIFTEAIAMLAAHPLVGRIAIKGVSVICFHSHQKQITLTP